MALTEEAKKKLEADKTAYTDSLKPLEERLGELAKTAELAATSATEVGVAKTAFDGQDEKARKAQAEWEKTLAGLTAKGKELADTAAKRASLLEELKASVLKAETPEALAALAPRKGELDKQFAAEGAADLAFVKEWREITIAQRLSAVASKVEKLPAKEKGWKGAKRDAEAKEVAALNKKATGRLKELQALKALDLGADATTATAALTKVDEASKELTELEAEVDEVLAKKVEAAVEEVKLTAAQKKRKADISALSKKVQGHLSSLRKKKRGLEKKAGEWKKAGNKQKSKDAKALVTDVEKLREGLFDIKAFLKKDELEAAQAGYDAISGLISPVAKAADKVIKEKVQVADAGTEGTAGTDGKGGTEKNLKAFLQTLKCPGGMKRMIVKNKKAKKDKTAPPLVAYCIDYYEYPGKGRSPKTNVSWAAANAACSAVGKRLCHNWEWRKGCGGKYPYGKVYDPERCNTVGEDGIERSVLAAGSKRKCRSPYGLYDMVGNVAEWTASKNVNGGDCYKTGEEATCYRSVKRFGGSSYVGFRCCADAK